MKTRSTVSLKDCKLVFEWNGLIISGGQVGYGKSITSVRDNRYIPGRWRYNPCTIIYGTRISKPETLRCHYGNVSGYLSANALANYTGSTTWMYTNPQGGIPGYVADKARIRANNNRLNSPFAGGVFLAELKETVSMLRKPVKTCLGLLQNARKTVRKRRSTEARRKAFESWWLEYRYGWTPAANDVDEIANRAIVGIKKAQKHFFTTHGKDKYVSSKSYDTGLLYKSAYFKVAFRVIETYTARCRGTCGWNYVVGYEDDETMASIGLGRPDMWAVMYEKIPFSFVLDWWLGVGDFLKYLRPSPWLLKQGEGVSLAAEWTRTHIPIRAVIHSRESKPPQEPYVIYQKYYNRGIPTSNVELPVLDPRFRSLKHSVDALALLIQQGIR